MGTQESDIVLIFISSALIAVLLAALVAIFVVVYQKRIVAKNLQLQQLENSRQQELLQATIDGQERERKRLAKDLHDGIGSLLSGLRLNLGYQQKSPGISAEQAEFLAEACKMIDEGMADVRRVSHDLLPATLEEFGLLQALEDHVAPLQQANDFSIALDSSGEFKRLPAEAELGILRVVQELLHNTIEHANASYVQIKVAFESRTTRISYTDNGSGFSEKNIKPGLGIKNVYSRIQALDGEFTIDKLKSSGFSATITVPKPQSA